MEYNVVLQGKFPGHGFEHIALRSIADNKQLHIGRSYPSHGAEQNIDSLLMLQTPNEKKSKRSSRIASPIRPKSLSIHPVGYN